VVSVTDQINEPRYPSFKGIMAAKKKPVRPGRSPTSASTPPQVGPGAAWSQVEADRPPAAPGRAVVTDEGDGGARSSSSSPAKKLV
jgi:electron transfer flavoprotein beta subunit